MMNRIIPGILFFAVLLSGCSSTQKEQPRQKSLSGNLEISKIWARPAGQGVNSAAYFTVYNGTTQADTLIGIASEDAANAEVHESYVTDEGLSGMRPAGIMAIPSGDSLALKPGGFHVMLMGIKRELTAGDSIKLTLQFSRSGSKMISAGIRRQAASN